MGVKEVPKGHIGYYVTRQGVEPWGFLILGSKFLPLNKQKSPIHPPGATAKDKFLANLSGAIQAGNQDEPNSGNLCS